MEEHDFDMISKGLDHQNSDSSNVGTKRDDQPLKKKETLSERDRFQDLFEFSISDKNQIKKSSDVIEETKKDESGTKSDERDARLLDELVNGIPDFDRFRISTVRQKEQKE